MQSGNKVENCSFVFGSFVDWSEDGFGHRTKRKWKIKDVFWANIGAAHP